VLGDDSRCRRGAFAHTILKPRVFVLSRFAVVECGASAATNVFDNRDGDEISPLVERFVSQAYSVEKLRIPPIPRAARRIL